MWHRDWPLVAPIFTGQILFNGRTFKLEEGHFTFQMKTFLKWTDWNSYLFVCDRISWIQELKGKNDFEKFSGIRLTFRYIVEFAAKFIKPLAEEDFCETRLFPGNLRPLQPLRCDRQNCLHPPQQKPSCMASLLVGDLVATATITAAPTALVVLGGFPLLPLLFRPSPQTMPWPSLTPTYISNAFHHGPGRKPVSCCLYQS